jgi:Icc-related predicted phosphoesterase
VRILASADIHGAKEVYEWLREAAADYGADLLILAGDLLIGGWEDEQSKQARTVVIPLLRTIPVPVCYVMGNDDHIDLGYEDGRIRPVHGRRLDFGAYGIAGYQYSTPFAGGCFEKPEGEIAADLCRIEPILDETTILVTHSPARGYADRIYSGHNVGCHALAELLARRNLLCHIHGHIHHSFGRAANHFNVAADGRKRAMIIDVPSLSHFAIEAQ